MMSQPMLHKLTLQYWFSCQLDYYGALCNLHCVPSDSSSAGHYTCDSNGQKVCRDGWIEPSSDCKTPHPCSSGVCLNGATCQPQGSGYLCQCQPDFGGVNCGLFLDPCQTRNPCKNGATCSLDPADRHRPLCQCPAQFTGPACDLDFDECLSGPCQHWMPCVNTYGGFQCNCTDPNYSGRLCETSACANSTSGSGGLFCFNGGSCISPAASGGAPGCSCPPGYLGDACEIPVTTRSSTSLTTPTAAPQASTAAASGPTSDSAGVGVTAEPLVAAWAPGTPSAAESLSGVSGAAVSGAAAGAFVACLTLAGLGAFLGVRLLRRRRHGGSSTSDGSNGGSFANEVYSNACKIDGRERPLTGDYSVSHSTIEEEGGGPLYESITGGGERPNPGYEIEA